MINYVKKFLFVFLLIPFTAFAGVPLWKIIPEQSNLTFTATQNGAPITGQFKRFEGEIAFDPDKLNESRVKIIIDLKSISAPSNQLSETLQTKNWLNVKSFPQAIFESHEFKKTGDKTYQSQGTLTIRNKTVPVTLVFTQEEYSATKARIKGSAMLKRTAFGVGQGEWADTKTVKDDVQINFVIVAVK